MSDLIERKALLDAFGLSEKTHKYGGDHSGYNTMMLYEIQDVIEGLPSAEPKTGRWIPMEVSSGRDSWKCSVCGRRARGKLENLPYCHCGCKMEVEHEDNH